MSAARSALPRVTSARMDPFLVTATRQLIVTLYAPYTGLYTMITCCTMDLKTSKVRGRFPFRMKVLEELLMWQLIAKLEKLLNTSIIYYCLLF